MKDRQHLRSPARDDGESKQRTKSSRTVIRKRGESGGIREGVEKRERKRSGGKQKKHKAPPSGAAAPPRVGTYHPRSTGIIITLYLPRQRREAHTRGGGGNKSPKRQENTTRVDSETLLLLSLSLSLRPCCSLLRRGYLLVFRVPSLSLSR